MNKMQKLLIVLFLVIALASAAKKHKKKEQQPQDLPDQAQAESEVTEMTEENTEEIKKGSKYVIVLVVNSDRATHKLIEDYPQLNHNLRENGITNFTLSIVDNQFYKDFARKEGVKKIPALLLFQDDGTVKDVYKGMNYVEDMFNWIYKTIKNPRSISKPIQNFAQLGDKIQQFDVFVSFFGTTPNTPEFKLYEQLASKKKDLHFVHTFDKECREENGYKDPELQGIVLYSKQEEQMNMNYINHYKGDLLNLNEIKQFLKLYTTQSMSMIRPWDTNKILQGTIPNLILGINQADFFQTKQNYEQLMTPEELTFLQLRPKLMNKVFLHILNVTDRNREEVRTIFELSENYTLPQVFIVEPVPQKPARKYIFDGDQINEQTMLQFVQDFKKGKLKALSSAEKPYPQERQDKLYLKHVVAENWDEYVYKNEKQDVLVFFYSIGCNTCEDLKRMAFNLAYRLHNNRNLLLVRVNIGDNDIPSVSVKRVPELKLYKANQKDYPVSFIYTTKAQIIIDALKEEVSFPWVEPIPESEVNQKDIIIDETDLEIYHNTVTKKKEEEAQRQQKEQFEREQRESKERQQKELEEKQQAEQDKQENTQDEKEKQEKIKHFTQVEIQNSQDL